MSTTELSLPRHVQCFQRVAVRRLTDPADDPFDFLDEPAATNGLTLIVIEVSDHVDLAATTLLWSQDIRARGLRVVFFRWLDPQGFNPDPSVELVETGPMDVGGRTAP